MYVCFISVVRVRASVLYVKFNMLTIGALYMQLSRKLFIRFKYSWIHWKPINVNFAVNLSVS